MFIIKSKLSVVIFFLSLYFYSEFAAGENQEQNSEPTSTSTSTESHGNSIQLSPLMEVESKVQELAAKIRSKKAFLQGMFEEKNKLKNNSPELKVKVQEIVKQHVELRRLSEEYEKQLNILKYRFPERNTRAKKKHDRIEIKSIIEMEQAMTVDGKLSRNLKKLRSQYGSDGTDATPTADAGDKHSTIPSSSAPQAPTGSIEDSGSILLKK